MHRIDNASAATALPTPAAPGPNPNGYWQQGDPGTSTPSTIMDQDWFNAVQEELCAVVTAAGITLDKTDDGQLLAAILAVPGKNIQAFTTSGTFTVPANVTKVKVTVIGGGAAAGYNSVYAGGGGGSGGRAVGIVSGLVPAASVTVTVGLGGTSPGTAGNGANGGTSSFGAYITAIGGTGGQGGTASSNAGGQGGTSSGGTVNDTGEFGVDGSQNPSSGIGVGGKGGGPGGGRGTTGFFTGAAASGYGGGGGGGGCAGGGGATGGNGRAGIVIVEY